MTRHLPGKSRISRRFAIATGQAALEARALLSTLVAIIDSGVDETGTGAADTPYYDLSTGYNAVSRESVAETGDPYIVQDSTSSGFGHHHGSTLADVIVRAIQDAASVPGAGQAAGDVKIMPIRAFANDQYDQSAMVAGIYWAADHGASVIDISYDFEQDQQIINPDYPHYGSYLSQAIQYAATKNVVVVTGCANEGVDIENNPFVHPYPALLDASNLIDTAAVDGSGNLGPTSNYGQYHVDLGAPTPGVDTATSFSAAYTSGITGIIANLMGNTQSSNPIQASQIVGVITSTVTPHDQSSADDPQHWSTTNGNINPAAAIAAVTTPPSSPVATSLGQDGHDYIGTGAGSSGPDGYQDVHIALTGLPTSKTIQWIDVNGVGGGEWRYNGAYGSDKAVLENYSPGGTTADLYTQPYQDETGRSYEVTIHYTDSTSTDIYSDAVYATAQLPVGSQTLTATSLGQDGHDYIGSGAGSSGPDGYQDVHISLTGLDSSKTVQWIDVNGVGGGEWRYNGAYGSDKAVLENYSPGGTTADLYTQPYQDETGRSYEITIYYTDSTSMTVYSDAVHATAHLPA